jgi:hypothetical protein
MTPEVPQLIQYFPGNLTDSQSTEFEKKTCHYGPLLWYLHGISVLVFSRHIHIIQHIEAVYSQDNKLNKSLFCLLFVLNGIFRWQKYWLFINIKVRGKWKTDLIWLDHVVTKLISRHDITLCHYKTDFFQDGRL